MALLPIKIPAGFFRNATQYQAKGRWFTGNLVRFSEGRLRPIGGWQRLASTQILKKGAVKALTIVATGTGYSAGNLTATGGGGSGFTGTYTVDASGAVLTTTITNYGSGYSTAPTIVISHAGNNNASITATTHGAVVDPIRGLHSWRLSTGARYLAVGSTQSLRIWDGSQSSGKNAPLYDITPASSVGPTGSIPFESQEDFLVAGLGFGSLEYGGDRNLDGTGGSNDGGGTYGGPRYPPEDPDVTDIDAYRDNFASVWSMANFGDDLLACHSGEGTIWHWSLASGGSQTKSFTVTSPSVITALTPVGPTPASIQPTTSGQWSCNDPSTGSTVEKTHTNVSQTSTSGSGTGAKFTVVTQMGTVMACNIYHGMTTVSGLSSTSGLTVGMFVHGLYTDVGHWAFGYFIQPTIAGIIDSTTIRLSRGNASGSGSYHASYLSFQNPSTGIHLKSVTVTNAGTGYLANDTIVLTDPGGTVSSLPQITGTATATITVSSVSDAVVTSTAHGLDDDDVLQVSSLGSLPTGLPAYTDLYVREKTNNTFKLAALSGGAAMEFTAGSGQHSWTTTTGGSISFNNLTQTATAPVVLANAPISNVAVLVTPERHIMVLGAGGNQRRIQWGHQEGLTGTATWNPELTNTAGDLDIQTKGKIIGGFNTRYGVLIFTTSDVWKTNYLGPPYVYGVERLTEGGGPVGMKAIAGSADFVAWMSRGRFWSFTGGYVQELSCDVADYVFSDINLDVEGLIAAGHNSEFGEIIWFYPKEGDKFNTRYVTYSYREKHWTTGELQRTALESSDALGYPVWAGADGYLYRHEMDPDTQSTPIPRESSVIAPTDATSLSGLESRVVANGVDSTLHPNVSSEEHLCFAESGSIEIGSGNRVMSVKQIITDTDAGTNGLRLKVSVRQTPDGASTEKGPYPLESDGYTDTRFVGRQAVLRVESPFDQEWRFGEVRFDASVSGSR